MLTDKIEQYNLCGIVTLKGFLTILLMKANAGYVMSSR